MEAFGSILLFLVFSVLAMIGAYLALATTKSKAAGRWAAFGTGLFFLLLYWGLAWVWRIGTAAVGGH
jgi:NADH:ubiquinone oxidoreductase subunit 3 (subunit A)